MSGWVGGCGRRAFLRQLGLATAAAVAGASCASAAALRVVPERGRIRLGPGELSAVRRPGGWARLHPDGFGSPVYLLEAGGGLVALSPICTHLGCTVGVEGARLVCPCHGSTYDRSGRVLRGPAERSLRAFPVEPGPDGSVVIDLNGSVP